MWHFTPEKHSTQILWFLMKDVKVHCWFLPANGFSMEPRKLWPVCTWHTEWSGALIITLQKHPDGKTLHIFWRPTSSFCNSVRDSVCLSRSPVTRLRTSSTSGPGCRVSKSGWIQCPQSLTLCLGPWDVWGGRVGLLYLPPYPRYRKKCGKMVLPTFL